MITLQRAEESEKAALTGLWEETFQDDGFSSYFFSIRFDSKYIYTAKDGEKLISALSLIPTGLWHEGQLLSALNMVGVCTAKEYRHQGIMASLLHKALDENPLPFILFPLENARAYYTRFAFCSCHVKRFLLGEGEIKAKETSLFPRAVYDEYVKAHGGAARDLNAWCTIGTDSRFTITQGGYAIWNEGVCIEALANTHTDAKALLPYLSGPVIVPPHSALETFLLEEGYPYTSIPSGMSTFPGYNGYIGEQY